MYAMLRTHPDISFTITIVSKFSSNPRIVHWEAMKQIYWYLISLKDLWLSYGGGEKELVGFADADGSMAVDDVRICILGGQWGSFLEYEEMRDSVVVNDRE